MIKVWITDISEPLPCHQYRELLSEIDIDKQQRIEKYRKYKDSLRSLIGDISIRALIYKSNFKEEGLLEFKTNEYGKPYLSGSTDIQFNISHSGNYVACAIGNTSIGIDLEYIKPLDLNIAKRFFTPNEYEFIMSETEDIKKYQRFYSVWTRKEAYIKQRGAGLQIPLQSFDVLESYNDVFFQCIHQSDLFICNICIAKGELTTTTFLSAQELVSIYKSKR